MEAREENEQVAKAPRRSLPSLGVEEWCLAGLLLLSLVGIAIADFSARSGLLYWIAMVPIFALACGALSWSRALRRGQSARAIVTQQALHWAALPAALYVVYLLERTGRLNREDAGLVALLALALTTVLAGIHFDWRIAVLGLLLGLTAVLAALVEEFFWLLAVPALLAGVAWILWQRRARRAPGPHSP